MKKLSPISFGSVCSGIEAASVAWEQLNFSPAWFSEIDKFTSSVLAHHFPGISNLGDLKGIKEKIQTNIASAPDVLVGGTPCQAFSVAGLRAGLADERGSLSLAFVKLADSIDEKRHEEKKPPAVVLWENVPGVLSTKDNSFGCFLGGLAGEDCPLLSPRGGWADAGCVFGPKRAIAWRVLDAQYFGVAQRRKRVFVCAVGNSLGISPAQILFEFEGSRLDAAPRNSSGQALASDAQGCSNDHEKVIVIQGNVIGRTPSNGPGGKGYSETGVAFTLNCTDRPAIATANDVPVRRLTPVEHERLQGFPDGWTDIPWRGAEGAPDSHRYHAIGNSMAVPVMRWIGSRIAASLRGGC